MDAFTIRVAAVQAESVWLDCPGGIDKFGTLVKAAAAKGAEAVGFPEAFIPGYPLRILNEGDDNNDVDQDFIETYTAASLSVDTPEFDQVKRTVAEAGIYTVFSFSERANGRLYLSQAFIDGSGTLLLLRRKVGLSEAEKRIFSEGGESLHSVAKGPGDSLVGALSSWEHLKPLLRYYTYGQGSQITVGSWPARPSKAEVLAGTAHGCGDVLNRMFAAEGGSFCLVCTGVISPSGAKLMGADFTGGGFARIFSPTGNLLAQANDPERDEILIADIDLDEIHIAKQMADCIGQYTRPELLSVTVKYDDPIAIQN